MTSSSSIGSRPFHSKVPQSLSSTKIKQQDVMYRKGSNGILLSSEVEVGGIDGRSFFSYLFLPLWRKEIPIKGLDVVVQMIIG